MPNGFSLLDGFIAASLGFVILNAARRGFLREIANLVGLVVGLLAAGRFAPDLAPMIGGSNSLLISYVGLLVGGVVLVVAATWFIRPVLDNPLLRLFDHMAGMALGVCEAVIAVGLTLTAASRVGMLSTILTPGGSKLAPFLSSWVDGVLRYLPPEIGSLERVISLVGPRLH